MTNILKCQVKVAICFVTQIWSSLLGLCFKIHNKSAVLFLDAAISFYNASFFIISSTFSPLACFLPPLFVFFSFLTSDTCYKPCGSFPALSLSFTHFFPSLQSSPQPSAIILCLDYYVQLFLVSLPPVSSSNLFWTSQTKWFSKIKFSEYLPLV